MSKTYDIVDLEPGELVHLFWIVHEHSQNRLRPQGIGISETLLEKIRDAVEGGLDSVDDMLVESRGE